MDEMPAQWEYYIEYIEASLPGNVDFVAQFYRGQKVPKYAVQAMLPRLNQLGDQGWELVQMIPVEVGVNGDIQVSGGEALMWSRVYQCTFKRRKS